MSKPDNMKEHFHLETMRVETTTDIYEWRSLEPFKTDDALVHEGCS